MSITLLRLCPTKPDFVPALGAQREAVHALSQLVETNEPVEAWYEPRIMFVDQGENFDAVFCPRCEMELNVEGWWSEAMNAAWNDEKGFVTLDAVVPCWGRTVSLNDLRYEFPAGFARFYLQVADPEANLSDGQRAELELILGCSLRVIYARY